MRKICIYPLFILIIALQACKKETAIQSTPQTTDTAQGTSTNLLPQSISFVKVNAPDQNITVTFKYLIDQHRINVYWDDTTTADLYDKLAFSFFYNNDGYLTKREAYDRSGNLYESITVDRTSVNTLTQVLYSFDDSVTQSLVKDTFAVSFADSLANPSFKFMTVTHTYRSPWLNPPDPVVISNRVTFQNCLVLKESGGEYYGQTSTSRQPSQEYTYDALGKRVGEKIDGGTYYTTAYSYETTGHALDSFFKVLEGRDGYLLDTKAFWGLYSAGGFTIVPLYAFLSTPNHVGIMVNEHQYGLLKEVRSVPSGTDLSFAETFDFENTLDDKQRITGTNITLNGSVYATWKIKY